MKSASDPEALRIQALLGPEYQVVEFETSTHTAAEAAQAVGCDLGQIAKSLVFVTRKSGQGVLVIASGAHRVDTRKIAALAGERVRAADADYIRDVCGFEPGGVSPVGHRIALLTLLDASLEKYDAIWAAAGTSNAVFKLTPAQLRTVTGGAFHDMAQEG